MRLKNILDTCMVYIEGLFCVLQRSNLRHPVDGKFINML